MRTGLRLESRGRVPGASPSAGPLPLPMLSGTLREIGVRLEEGITIWITAEQLRGRVANEAGRPEPVGTPMEQELRSLHATHVLGLAMMEARGVSMVRRPREERARQRQAIFGPWERRFRVESESRGRQGQARDSDAFARAAARMEEVGRLGCEGEDPRFYSREHGRGTAELWQCIAEWGLTSGIWNVEAEIGRDDSGRRCPAWVSDSPQWSGSG